MATKLTAHLDPAFAVDATCYVGDRLRVPLHLSSSAVDQCTIQVSSDGNIVEAVALDVQLIKPDDDREIVLDVLACRETSVRAWVRVAVECEGAPIQLMGFFLTVIPAPQDASEILRPS
jgi:hypothetical protein